MISDVKSIFSSCPGRRYPAAAIWPLLLWPSRLNDGVTTSRPIDQERRTILHLHAHAVDDRQRLVLLGLESVALEFGVGDLQHQIVAEVVAVTGLDPVELVRVMDARSALLLRCSRLRVGGVLGDLRLQVIGERFFGDQALLRRLLVRHRW
ncbi:hypothetical protein DIE08_05985 [Burkholderia sp. Bp9004]|nr:hypothetical protein DIE08_05985 [Burkholderia sp. Bp9004]